MAQSRNMIIRVWPLKRREMFRWNPVTPAIQAWIDKQASTDNFKSYMKPTPWGKSVKRDLAT